MAKLCQPFPPPPGCPSLGAFSSQGWIVMRKAENHSNEGWSNMLWGQPRHGVSSGEGFVQWTKGEIKRLL